MDLSHDSWENKSCLGKLELGFWTYSLICLPGPSGPNIVSGPQTPRSKYFLRFHNFIDSSHDSWENVVLFVKIEARFWTYMSWCIFRTQGQVAQIYFLGPRPQGPDIFWDFIILLNSSHDSWGLVCENWG